MNIANVRVQARFRCNSRATASPGANSGSAVSAPVAGEQKHTAESHVLPSSPSFRGMEEQESLKRLSVTAEPAQIEIGSVQKSPCVCVKKKVLPAKVLVNAVHRLPAKHTMNDNDVVHEPRRTNDEPSCSNAECWRVQAREER